ncbi:hypothetical protein [Pyramidobacter sp. CG50-2]|uniref:hypothetical protein n=1 Tax=Pyramidobacter sp. CG50-2 TaxID=2382160 RepID=UPI000EA20F06|nr:hypothetical protein [Pyramidobacter sp. CG50-2]RKJ78796.1 hypothetical protein D7D26_06050 [Pyramidobacter sp. CG50-2]
MATYGPGENAFNFDPVEEGGDRTDTAFAKTKAQFDTLYENLNRDIPGVYPSNENPRPNGVATPGADITYARGQHVHPLQENVSGNAGTADKWKLARTLNVTGAVSGSVQIDGSSDVALSVTSNIPLPFLPTAGGNVSGPVAPTVNSGIDLGSSARKFRTVFADTFSGRASNAEYLTYTRNIKVAHYNAWIAGNNQVGRSVVSGSAYFNGSGDIVINVGCASGCASTCISGCSNSCAGGCSGGCTNTCSGSCGGICSTSCVSSCGSDA